MARQKRTDLEWPGFSKSNLNDNNKDGIFFTIIEINIRFGSKVVVRKGKRRT